MHGVAHFLRHLAEMVLAMLVGMAVLGVIVTAGFRALGYPAPMEQLPELSTLAMAAEMAIPMALWMSFRGHHRRLITEMVAAMVAPALVLVAAAQLGALPASSIHHIYHPVMYVAMLGAMLLRYGAYSTPMSSHAAGATASALHRHR